MKYRFLLLVLLFAATSCATIMNTSKQTITFSSNPTNAEVFINSERAGVTPITKSLERKGEYHIKITLNGYYPYEKKLTRKIDGWFFGNILLGGIIGIIVDASTGAMYQLTPGQIKALLTEKGSSVQARKKGNLYVLATLETDPTWKKVGNMTKI